MFFALGRDPDLSLYRRSLAPPTPANPKLSGAIYNCEFLGFLDREKKRVGCLLHPSLHQGVNLREYSFYGPDLCAGHFCPSFTHLTKLEQEAVLTVLDDWYLYGLVITDIDLVKEFFRHVQDRLGESLHVERLVDSEAREALRAFFRLKEFWKFASTENRLGKYDFSHSEYQIARIEYEKNWKIKPPRFAKILLSLSSAFKTQEDILEAEYLIEEKIKNFTEAYLSASPLF